MFFINLQRNFAATQPMVVTAVKSGGMPGVKIIRFQDGFVQVEKFCLCRITMSRYTLSSSSKYILNFRIAMDGLNCVNVKYNEKDEVGNKKSEVRRIFYIPASGF